MTGGNGALPPLASMRDVRKVYRRGTGQVSEETVKGGNERFTLVSVSRG